MSTLAKVRNGRKYKLALITMTLLLAAFGLVALVPTLERMFPDLATALVGTLLVYCGGNVGNKFVTGKGIKFVATGEDESKQEDTPKGQGE